MMAALLWTFVQWGPGRLAADWRPEPGTDLVSFTVKGASYPGARCKVMVAGPPHRWLSLPAQPCRWSQGDGIELPRRVVQRGWPADKQGPRVLWVRHYIGHQRRSRGYWVALAKWRMWLYQACGRDPGSNFVLASLSGMPRVLRWLRLDQLRQAGLGHLTAVSGLHVGTLAHAVGWIAMRIAGLLPRPKGGPGRFDIGQLFNLCFCALPLLAFVMATGAAASACRALLCWGLWALAAGFGLNLHRLSLLGAIALGMLAWCPAWLSDPGFYFSFVATAILLWPDAQGRTRDEAAPSSFGDLWGAGKGMTIRVLSQSSWSTSWRLFWALAPLSLWFFKKASLVAVLANLVAIPVFAGWVMPLGLCAVGIAACSELLGCAGAAYDLVVALFSLAGMGGVLILDLARCLSAVPQGGPWHWTGICAVALLLHPRGRPLSPLHPLRWAPTPLLWVLMCAPLWAY